MYVQCTILIILVDESDMFKLMALNIKGLCIWTPVNYGIDQTLGKYCSKSVWLTRSGPRSSDQTSLVGKQSWSIVWL